MEIIPNWHPLFVHFTVALLPLATLFFLLSTVVKGKYSEQWMQVAYWVLWSGVVLSVLTVISGIVAYNSVNHDTPSHLAMTDHRNWALPTFLVYVVVGIWSLKMFKSGVKPNPAFLVMLVIAGLLLASTGWRGGELVYRHGLGVMSLPKAEGGDGHDHDHGVPSAKDKNGAASKGATDHHDIGDGHHDKEVASRDNSDGLHDKEQVPHDNSDGHHDKDKAAHDNSDGHHDKDKVAHDNSDGHHDKEKAPHDNSDGHQQK